MANDYPAIEAAKDALYAAKTAYLRRYGWNNTCNTPGAFWLWQRDFADVDAKRLAWWEGACASKPPLGNPTKPRPMGMITADTDLAVSMTRSCLDEREGEEKIDG